MATCGYKLYVKHDDKSDERVKMANQKDADEKDDNKTKERVKMVNQLGADESHNRKDENECSSKKIPGSYYILILMLIAGVTCLVSMAVTIAIVKESKQITELSEMSPRVLSHSACIQCIKLIRNPFNNLDPDPHVDRLTKRVEDGIQMCCSENEEQMSAILEATLKEQVTRPIPVFKGMDSSLKFSLASAHKQLLPHNESEVDLTEPHFTKGSEHFIVRFNKNYTDPLTEHAKGVTVLDSALLIQHSGIYYVYLNVHMIQKFKLPTSSFHYQWNQYVHRRRLNSSLNSGVLLETAHKGCQNCKQQQETAFVGGTFYLKEGDLIEVCINALGTILFKKESSYLGLIMLSTGSNSEGTYEILSR